MSNSGREDLWTAGVFIFSGRPNPSWPMPSAWVAELMAIWSRLSGGSTPWIAPEDDVRLGYSGCYLSNGIGERWLARDARVIHQHKASAESRDDPLRRFELALLQSAPENTLPADLVDRLRNEPI